MNYPTRSEIEELTPADRLRLIEDVWESLEQEQPAIHVSPAQHELLADRLRRFEKEPGAVVRWSDALRRLQHTG